MKRYKVKSIVAFFIAICLTVSAIGVVPVQAAGTIIDEPGKLTISDVIHDVEEIEEAITDSE
ncbi:MAG: hypothetical protein NC393_02750 [Clostridium sp.]|nr:hypothetical protein [Clostridium sp.]MCM1208383.1 hypothetical protein [Ruminococcus sp.]